MEVTRLLVVPSPWCALCPPVVSTAVAPGWALERGPRGCKGAGKRPPQQEGGIQTWTVWEQPDFCVATMASTRKLGRKPSKPIPGAILHHAHKNEYFWN